MRFSMKTGSWKMSRFSKSCVCRWNSGAVKTWNPELVLTTEDVIADELMRGSAQSILIDDGGAIELVAMCFRMSHSECVNALSVKEVAVYVSVKNKTKNMKKTKFKVHLHAIELDENVAFCVMLFLFIHWSILWDFIMLSYNLNMSSSFFFSSSILCCLFLIIAFISFDLTFLFMFHWLKQLLYCWILSESV